MRLEGLARLVLQLGGGGVVTLLEFSGVHAHPLRKKFHPTP